jgi:hypothetical protein
MSLIVDINPVPWKILDLVKARILKNRAKKAKKGLDWSKETLRREMALSPAPLISRRRDEPSFVPSGTFITYTIEGVRDFDVIGDGTGAIVYTVIDEWTIYAEWDGYEKKIWAKLPFLDIKNDSDIGAPRSAVYISTFVDPQTGDELAPLISWIAYSTSGAGGPINGIAGVVLAMTLEDPIPFDSFPETTQDPYGRLLNPALIPASGTNLLAGEYNPLHAWTPGSPDQGPAFSFNYGVTAASPLANEYDISRIELASGYNKTSSVALTEETSYSVSITVDP